MSENAIKLLAREHKEEDQKLLDWLSSGNYTFQQQDLFQQREPETGLWLLSTPEYQQWLTSRKKILLCHGVPGTGKTVLASVVVNDLAARFGRDNSVGVAYTYFNFNKQKETAEDLVGNVVKQLAQRQAPLPDRLEKLRDLWRTVLGRPSLDNLSRMLEAMTVHASRVFIVVDGLWEDDGLDRAQERFLAATFNLQRKAGVNIFVTSASLQPVDGELISLEIASNEHDMRKYIKSRMASLPIVTGQQKKVEDAIVQSSDGRFLLVQLHLESISRQTSNDAVQTAVSKLNGGSEDKNAYDDAMDWICRQPEAQKMLALHALSWLTYSKSTLTKVELQHALAVDYQRQTLKELPSVEDIVSMCAGLATFYKNSGVVRLIHDTARQYLDEALVSKLLDAESRLAETCMAYLKLNGYVLEKYDQSHYGESYRHPFYDYTALNWGHHARSGSPALDSLLRGAKSNASRSEKLWYRERLHIAAYMGFEDLAKALLEKGVAPDALDSSRHTPLWYAARKGRDSIVKMLLATNKVDVDIQVEEMDYSDMTGSTEATARFWTPLASAAKHGHASIVTMLLDKGKANVNLIPGSEHDDDGDDGYSKLSPLAFAAKYGHASIVKLLLETGKADVNSKHQVYNRGALAYAAMAGHEDTVKALLVSPGIDVNTPNEDEDFEDMSNLRTPLSYAAEYGHEDVVELLFDDPDIDVDLAGRDSFTYGTPLSYAAEAGSEAIVKLLLDTGMVDLKWEDELKLYDESDFMIQFVKWGDSRPRPPLWSAMEGGNLEVVKLLLDTREVDANTTDGSETALAWAVRNERGLMVKLLLDSGKSDKTALSIAEERGDEAMVKLLRDLGEVTEVDLNAKC